jgi:hypothetical protein
MLNQPLMEKLLAMRLQGMVEGLKAQEQDRAINELSFLERLSLLIDQQCRRTWGLTTSLATPGCVQKLQTALHALSACVFSESRMR